jgi:methyl-accepting chemotaxis protein
MGDLDEIEDKTYVTKLHVVKVGGIKKQIGYIAIRFDKTRLVARANWEQYR